MILNNIPERKKKKQYSTKLKVEAIDQLHKISRSKGISQAVLLEHLIALAYNELPEEEK